jgi:hypothetical protein
MVTSDIVFAGGLAVLYVLNLVSHIVLTPAEYMVSNRGNSSQSWVKNTNMTDCISSL